MKHPGSSFVTPVGMGITLALLLVSAYLGIAALQALLLVLLLLFAVAYFWARYSLRKIEVEVFDEDCCAFPGSELEVQAKITNGKLLPLIWLRVEYPTRGCACIGPAEDMGEADEDQGVQEDGPCLGADFSWVMPHQSLYFTQRAKAVSRGVCECRSLILSSGDGFGLSTRVGAGKLKAAFRFVVYPELIPVDAAPILRNMSELEKHKSGLYIDNTLISSVRDYRAGDSFRDINWRLFAREDKVQVNVRERLAMRRVCFLPDLQSFSYVELTDAADGRKDVRRVRSAELERMFSLMASLVVKLNENGVLCSLAVPPVGAKAWEIITPETTEVQVMQLLAAMAEVSYKGEEAPLPAEEIMERRHLLGQLFMFSYDTGSVSGEEFVRRMDGFTVLRIVQQTRNEEETFDRSIFKEMEFTGA